MVARTLAWRVYEAFTDRPITLRIGSYRMRCHPGSTYARQVVRFNGRPDYDGAAFMEAYLRPGDSVLDVGANIGGYSLLAANCVGAKGRVVAFEPTQSSAARLRENIVLNRFDQVCVRQIAANAQSGVIPLVVGRDSGNRIQTATAKDETERTESVQCELLDVAVGSIDFALGKVDVEGAEPLVFLGAEKMLSRGSPPVWLFELNGKIRDFGYSEEWLIKWLDDHGFDIALYNADESSLSFGADNLRNMSHQHGEANLLAVSRHAREMVLERVAGADTAGLASCDGTVEN